MLLRFSAENHLSIKGRAEISMVAAKLRDYADGLIATSLAGIDTVPAALIYGPNASGKSNLLLALLKMRDMVLDSQLAYRPDSELSRVPFALDPASADVPTRFEVDFMVESIRYFYGFSFLNEGIEEEWLTSYPNGREVSLFTRYKQDFRFGRRLKGRNAVIAELTRRNSLFLSAAAQNDHQELSPIYRFFSNIEGINSIAVAGYSASSAFDKDVIDQRIINFLRNIGTGVVGYRKREESLDPGDFRMEVAKSIWSIYRKNFSEKSPEALPLNFEKSEHVELGHVAVDGTTVYFDLDRESSGTRRLLVMLSKVFHVLDHGGLIIIDELDASLHTQACGLIFGLFSDKQYNRAGAQLIATIHDTNLLVSEYVRRDQIWLAEKTSAGESTFKPLSDVRLRSTDDFEKGYLQGRFQALPLDTSIKTQLEDGTIISP